MTTPEVLGINHCSFCGKDKGDVKKLIAGPGIYICDECVQLCNGIIDEEAVGTPADLPTNAPPEVVLAWLRGVSRTLQTVQRDLATKVGFLRAHGIGWTEIATALEEPEEEVRARFSG